MTGVESADHDVFAPNRRVGGCPGSSRGDSAGGFLGNREGMRVGGRFQNGLQP